MEKSFIIEAPGNGKVSHTISIYNMDARVRAGTEIMRVRTTLSKRVKAGTRAMTYVGRPYNNKFWDNKKYAGNMNCSQLVWAAYKSATGIDLDGDGGKGVYLRDIKKSSWTYTYAYVQ
ncbi:MAG: hypothetical protein J6M18_02610 [Actinomycetaceae bacterium]|nr:hypothetical protein [Actinomycetaceae bacterium]